MKKRYRVLDALRGFAILNMIAYHAVFDLVYLFGVDWQWYESDYAYLWQQGICWSFIFLSGFSWCLGRHQLKRGLQVFLGGALISIITCVFMPEERILFGILTFLGTAMLIMIPLHRILQRVIPSAGFFISMILFTFTRNINDGYLGLFQWKLWEIPESWKSNFLMTYLGFTPDDFFSADYFSILPWLFLFVAGYFMYRFLDSKQLLSYLEKCKLPVMEWLGRHSLGIYMLHQPIIYLVLSLVFLFI